MKINLITQGYKYNHILTGDILIDARCLVNPYYEDNLRSKTGLDKKVKEYILKDSYTQKYLEDLKRYLETYLVGRAKKSSEVTILIMCTGGRHRSVFLAEELRQFLSKKYEVEIKHVDIYA